MKLALAQINTSAADFETTARRMEELSRTAAERGAELLVFPMVALTGPYPPDYPNQEGYLLDLSETLVGMSDALACPCIVPVVTAMDGEPFAEAMLVRDGSVTPLRLGTYLSAALGQGGPASAAGGETAGFEMGGLHFAVAFTYDDIDAAVDVGGTVDALLYLPVYGYALDDAGSALGAALAENRFRGDARALDAWLVAVGSLGGYSTQVYTGSSFVLAPDGELVASAPAFEEALVFAEVGDRLQKDLPESFEDEVYNRSLHLWEALSLGLHDFVSKQGKTDVALVLDTSLPSLLLAVLASDAVGPRHVHAVAGWTADDASESLARRLADVLELDVVDAHLQPVGDEAYRRDLLEVGLAALVRATGAVALSEMDKTYLCLEATEGSCKAAALLPFGDVYRSDLIELAHMRNTISPVIAREAYTRYDIPTIEGLEAVEPSKEARLRRVDVTLATHIEWERSLTDCVARHGHAEVTGRILRRLHAGVAVRGGMAPQLIVSSRTLSDARMPLGMVWEDRMRGKDERVRAEELMRQMSGIPALSADVSDEPSGLSDALEGLAQGVQEGPAKELLGLLRDMLQNGGEAGPGGPFGPMTWGSPFSEN